MHCTLGELCKAYQYTSASVRTPMGLHMYLKYGQITPVCNTGILKVLRPAGVETATKALVKIASIGHESGRQEHIPHDS